MNYLDRIKAEPSLALLIVLVGGALAAMVYLVLTSISF